MVYAPGMSDPDRSPEHRVPDPATPEPELPMPGPPNREGSRAAQREEPVVHTPPGRVSSAIRTAPNAVTLARLLLMPVCAYLLASGRYGWGLVLTAVVGSTDWVDGWLARRYGQVSRLGQLLDPLADRLLIASVAIALVVRGVLPWPAAVLLVALPVLTLGATGLAVAPAAHLLGLVLLWAGVAMYYLAGAVYVRMVLEQLGHRAEAGS